MLYFSVAISGFAALGNTTGGNIILSLPNGPKWVRNVARIFVVVHVLAAYQVGRHTRAHVDACCDVCRMGWEPSVV